MLRAEKDIKISSVGSAHSKESFRTFYLKKQCLKLLDTNNDSLQIMETNTQHEFSVFIVHMSHSGPSQTLVLLSTELDKAI